MTRRVRRDSFFSTPVKTNNKTQDVPLRVSLAKQPLIPGNRAGCMGFFTPASTIQNCHVLIWQNLYNTMAWLRQETGGGAAVRIAAGFYQGCNAERLYQNQNHSEGCSAHQGQGAGVQNSAGIDRARSRSIGSRCKNATLSSSKTISPSRSGVVRPETLPSREYHTAAGFDRSKNNGP